MQGYKSVKWLTAIRAYKNDPVGIKRLLGQSPSGELNNKWINKYEIKLPKGKPIEMKWIKTVAIKNIPKDDGVCFKYNNKQIAIFSFNNKFYATQNLCPHDRRMVLSRGILGDKEGEPKIACPMHKRTFSLETGENFELDTGKIETYQTEVKKGFLYVRIPESY